VPVDVGLFNLV